MEGVEEDRKLVPTSLLLCTHTLLTGSPFPCLVFSKAISVLPFQWTTLSHWNVAKMMENPGTEQFDNCLSTLMTCGRLRRGRAVMTPQTLTGSPWLGLRIL